MALSRYSIPYTPREADYFLNRGLRRTGVPGESDMAIIDGLGPAGQSSSGLPVYSPEEGTNPFYFTNIDPGTGTPTEGVFRGGPGGLKEMDLSKAPVTIAPAAPAIPTTAPIDAWQQKKAVHEQVTMKGRELSKSPEEISQELRFRGISADFDPFTPPVKAATMTWTDEGGKRYELTPEQYAKMEEFKAKRVKEEKLPSKLEEFEILNPSMKALRGTPEYAEAFGKMKPSEGLGFGDKEIIKKTLTEIPKLKREATTAAVSIEQIENALDLTTKGVTGKGGQLMAFLAPYAEAVGVPSEAMNDAQKFQLLTRAIIGPMRLEIVGPGPVSEWEQKLMQQISGGGGTAKGAAQELLQHWKRLSEGRLDAYNDTLTGFSEIYPAVTKVYKPIERKGKALQEPLSDQAVGAGTGWAIKRLD